MFITQTQAHTYKHNHTNYRNKQKIKGKQREKNKSTPLIAYTQKLLHYYKDIHTHTYKNRKRLLFYSA